MVYTYAVEITTSMTRDQFFCEVIDIQGKQPMGENFTLPHAIANSEIL